MLLILGYGERWSLFRLPLLACEVSGLFCYMLPPHATITRAEVIKAT